jgi:hypothetical protein
MSPLNSKWRVYRDPTFPPSNMLMGYKGNSYLDLYGSSLKVGQLVRWKKCVGRITRILTSLGLGEAHVHFFYPTVWYQDVPLRELEPTELLDVIAEESE